MSETEHEELTEPEVADVPEPDQPTTDETDAEEAEAEQAESHEPAEGSDDDATEDDDAPENVGTQASAKESRDEQKMIDKMFDQFARETERHTKRVAEIAGDSAPDLLQCPMCAPDEGQPNITGWLLPVKPSETKIANVRAAIGLAPKIDYREDPHSKVCPTCGGLKSVVPAGGDSTTPLLPCADCQAQGWQATDEVRGGARTNGTGEQNVTLALPGVPQIDPDAPEVAALKAAGYTVIAPYKVEA